MPGAANQPGRFHLATTLSSESTLLACAVLVAMLGLPGRTWAQSGPDPQQVSTNSTTLRWMKTKFMYSGAPT